MNIKIPNIEGQHVFISWLIVSISQELRHVTKSVTSRHTNFPKFLTYTVEKKNLIASKIIIKH